MKKAVILFLVLTIVSVLAVTVFADVGYMPPEEDTLLVGLGGVECYTFSGEEYYFPLEFGTVIEIESRNTYDEPPSWRANVPNLEGGTVYAVISPEEYDKLLRPYDLVTPDQGVGERVPGTMAEVTPSTGLNLRYGPHENFDIVDTIPAGTRVYYEYEFNGWCYTEYSGMRGWSSLDYLEAVAETEPPVTEPPAPDPIPDPVPDPGPTPDPDPEPYPVPDPVTEPATETAPVTTAGPETEPVETEESTDVFLPVQTDDGTDGSESATENPGEQGKKPGSRPVSKTVLYCVVAAVIASVTALVIILIVVKKGRKPADDENEDQNGDQNDNNA